MSVTSSTSGPNVTMTWGGQPSTVTISGLVFTFDHTTWSIGGTSSSFASGSGSTTANIGYSAGYSGSVTWYYKRTGHADYTVSEGTSGSTGPQPVTNKSVGCSAYSSRLGVVTINGSASCTGGTVSTLTNVFGGSGYSHGGGSSSTSASDSVGYGYSTSVSCYSTAVFSDGSQVYSSTTTVTTPGPVASFSASSSGPYVNLSWSASGSTQVTSYTVNGSAVAVNNQGGSTSVYVGYSASWTASITDNFSGYGTPSSYSASGTTPPAPPAPPAAVTDLNVSVNGSSQAVLTWTGTASGFRIYRNGALVTSVSANTYTDTATPTTRPLSYYLVPYNSSAGGTTDGSSSNIVTLGAVLASVGILMG